MAKYEVTLEKVFGACIRRTVTVEAENLEEAIDNAKDESGSEVWQTAYKNLTVDNLSEEYEWGSIIVNGETIKDTTSGFGHDLLDDAVFWNALKMKEGA